MVAYFWVRRVSCVIKRCRYHTLDKIEDSRKEVAETAKYIGGNDLLQNQGSNRTLSQFKTMQILPCIKNQAALFQHEKLKELYSFHQDWFRNSNSKGGNQLTKKESKCAPLHVYITVL